MGIGGARTWAGGAVIVSSLALAACTGVPPSSDPGEAGQEWAPEVSALMDRFVAETGTPGLLVGVWQGDEEFVRGVGVADLLTGAPIEREQQYRIGSQTKVMVGTIILQLAEEGSLDLDDPVSRWVDGVQGGDRIRVRQLLNHTGGLGDSFQAPVLQASIMDGCTPEQIIEQGLTVDPVGEPGEQWFYSNLSWHLLGWIAQEASGEELSELIRERIADPLGLQRTGLPSGIEDNGLTPPAMHGYVTGTDASMSDTPPASADAVSLPASCVWAAGGGVSTLDEMRVWVEAMAGGELLGRDIWEEALANPVRVPSKALGPGEYDWYLGPMGFGTFIGHQGGLPGYESASYHDPVTGTTIVLVSNKQFASIAVTGFAEEIAMAVVGAHAAPISPGEGFAKLDGIP